jgi:hypothetical protein
MLPCHHFDSTGPRNIRRHAAATISLQQVAKLFRRWWKAIQTSSAISLATDQRSRIPIMDQRAAGYFPQDFIPHTCQHCNNIVFTLEKAVYSTVDKVKEAISDECILFQIILQRCVDNGAPSDASTVVASCDRGETSQLAGWLAKQNTPLMIP